MREVNFSIPSVNKASVNITTTLYDRRALDCTSTLPLINSLNHLAYLTTSSARIRDILTVDGGIERLVCILKEGRSQDLMEMWKWSLAFQCVVNIGVRGSENVRTRVVEADMVPVIATILDNYIKVFDKARARMDAEAQKHSSRHAPKSIPTTAAGDAAAARPSFLDSPSNNIIDENNNDNIEQQRPSRRQGPPPNIEIPQPLVQENNVADAMDITSSPPRMPMTSPPERSAFGQEISHHNHHHHHHHRHHHHHHARSNEGRYQAASHRHRAMQPLATAVPTIDTTDGFNLRPVRDTERLPSMLPRLHTGFTSQPDSPTTPNGLLQTRNDAPTASVSPAAFTTRQRPALHQHPSASGESDDGNGEGSAAGDDTAPGEGEASEPIVGLQNQMEIDGVGDRQTMLDDVSNTHDLTVTDPSEGQDAETFNITHRSAVDGSMINNDTAQTNGALGLSPARTANNANSPVLVPSPYAFYYRDRATSAAQGVLTAMPRDEDVLMSLQLLAYVSKYCNLRSFFQHSHLVPKLKIDRELSMLDDPSGDASPVDVSEEDEYLLPDDVNIFPLVEKFTVRHHSKDMRYWACVVMRNLCRKDESRGGIRQCAYYKCGKWEEFQRQFAKCRRCRRTKYCSKDCQKAAWVYHRHWCHTTP